MNSKNPLKTLASVCYSWYNKRNPGERRLLLMLSFISVCSFYFSLILKPSLNEISGLKIRRQEYLGQMEKIKLQYPDVAKSRREITDIKQSAAELKTRIEGIESKLISVSQEQVLLTEIIKQAQDLDIDLESVKQEVREEKGGFYRLCIDLKFSVPYRKIPVYITGVESLVPFIAIEKMSLSQSKNDPVLLVDVSLTLNTILSRTEDESVEIASAKRGKEAVDFKRSPFAPAFLSGKSQKRNLKVNGITYSAEGSTAIINGTIVRVGDSVEKMEVKRILKDSVIIDTGAGEETLFLSRDALRK